MPHYDSDDLGSGVFFDADEAPSFDQVEAAFGPPTFSGTLAELEEQEAATL
jgi:hypothetical protein